MLIQAAAQLLSKYVEEPQEELIHLLETPPRPEWGDVSLPCFRFAKRLRLAPQRIAVELAERLNEAENEDGLTASAEGAYLNLTFERSTYIPKLLEQMSQDSYGSLQLGKGQRVVIDMSSPNIAKPFGIGHLRSTVIGAALYRILQAVGYETVSVNHLGDWGTQFGKQIVAYKRWGVDELLEADPIGASLQLYVRFHEEVEHQPELEDEARDWFRRLEQGDLEAQRLWHYFVTISLKEFNRMYDRLGITFDHVLGESFYNDKMGAVVEALKEKGLLEESDGALVVRLDDLELPPCLILKKDGTTIYPTRDLATAIYRHDSMEADRLLYVVGAEQQLHFRQVFTVLERMGYDWAQACEHVPFGLMKMEGKKMSTRRGKVLKLEEVLNEAAARALAVIEEKSPQLPERELVAEAVGVGAIIFGDLKHHRTNEIDFSLEEAVQFDGETGPYLQYTYARTQSVLRKLEAAAAEPVRASASSVEGLATASIGTDDAQEAAPTLGEAGWSLLKQLATYQAALERAAVRLEPSQMARFALDTAQAFNRFYHQERIDGGGVWRREVTVVTAMMLGRALELLGIQAPERM